MAVQRDIESNFESHWDMSHLFTIVHMIVRFQGFFGVLQKQLFAGKKHRCAPQECSANSWREAARKPRLCSAILWMDKILHNCETMVETITFAGIYRGIASFPGFLGAKWISSLSTNL